jgi:hypothetical protein
VAKGQSDRGVRTEDSETEDNVPVTDAVAGDEGIDDGLGGKSFKPGRRESFVDGPRPGDNATLPGEQPPAVKE